LEEKSGLSGAKVTCPGNSQQFVGITVFSQEKMGSSQMNSERLSWWGAHYYWPFSEVFVN
jgi:hypothetical protein